MTRLLAGRSRVLAALAASAALALAGCSDDSSPTVSAPTTAADRGSESSSSATTEGSSTESSSSPETSSSSSSSTESSSSSSTESSSSSSSSGSVPGTDSDLIKLCSAGQADTSAQQCRSAESSVTGSTIYCSADLPASATGNVRATLYRNGNEVYSSSTNRPAGSGSLMLNFSVGDLKLPGGAYGCTFSAGSETWRGATTVNGPTGVGSQGMACDGTSMRQTGAAKYCTSNNATLNDPSSIGCSAVVTDTRGKKVEGRFNSPRGSRTVLLSANYQMGMAVVNLVAPKSALGGSFPSGSYSCDFLIDGQPVINIPFSLG